jgi:hypothetical protein
LGQLETNSYSVEGKTGLMHVIIILIPFGFVAQFTKNLFFGSMLSTYQWLNLCEHRNILGGDS